MHTTALYICQDMYNTSTHNNNNDNVLYIIGICRDKRFAPLSEFVFWQQLIERLADTKLVHLADTISAPS